jgi:multiple sugar transport system ATP-binding protein
MVVVGPSGCGKSTLLRLLAGLETVTHGTLRIDGRVVNGLTPQQRNVAMVLQDYALYPHRTVRGNLEFPLRMRSLGREEIGRRVEWAAGLLGLAATLDRLPKELSGGERQRVAMGRALVREPSVFLLDEPLSNLDAKLRTEVRAEIANLQRRTRTTMLYVTHDQVEAMTLGQRIAVLDRGRLQQVGTAREVYERPANLFVAGFIGNPPMSLFPTRLSVDAGRLFMSVGRQAVPLDGTEVEALAALSGKVSHAGVRPEALSVGGVDRNRSTLEARIDHVESLGHETLAAVSCGAPPEATRLVVRIAAMPELSPGDSVRISVDPRGVYLFDASGAAIGAAAPRTTCTT